jgi:hypothetical protein
MVAQALLDVQELPAPNVVLEVFLEQGKIRTHQLIAGANPPLFTPICTISPGPFQGN